MSSRLEKLLKELPIRDLPQRTVCRVAPSTSLGEVYRLLDETHSVAVLICDDEGRLLGIFTERDILQRTALEGDPTTPIEKVMTRVAVTLGADQRVSDVIRAMTEKGVRHIPLLDAEGREAGMVGGRDILRLISEHYPETVLNLPPRLDQQMTRPEGG